MRSSDAGRGLPSRLGDLPCRHVPSAYYYTYTAWMSCVRKTPRRLHLFKHLRDFFPAPPIGAWNPMTTWVSEGYCLAEPGRELRVFLNQSKPSRSSWMASPRHSRPNGITVTGKRQKAEALANGTTQLQQPPIGAPDRSRCTSGHQNH